MPNPKLFALCIGTIAAIFALGAVVPDYWVLTLTRILILAVFAMGYNLLMGYAGMLSLGHALFFAAGLYGAGLASHSLGLSLPLAFAAGIFAAGVVSLTVGMLALRTQGVSFMIVTLMFAQVGYLLTLQFSDVTGGDQGFSLAARSFAISGHVVDLTAAPVRFNIAAGVFALTLLAIFALTQGRLGRTLASVRENPARTRMLGYDVGRIRLAAFVLSGTICGTAGALYALMFGYVGSSFAEFRTSVEVLLYTLVGGPATVLGPLLGAALMSVMIERISGWTAAYPIVVGILLIALVLWFPKGILGTIRDRWMPWLK